MPIKWIKSYMVLLSLFALNGCATLPSGPSVLVLPAPGKPFAQFQSEDMTCRQWAGTQIGMSAQNVANQNTATGAVVGTALGTGAGALLGAASGDTGTGAAIGAGTGLIVGTASGANAGQVYGAQAQQQYDFAYIQCMYSKGNQIPTQVHQYRIRKVTAPPVGTRSVPPDYIPY